MIESGKMPAVDAYNGRTGKPLKPNYPDMLPLDWKPLQPLVVRIGDHIDAIERSALTTLMPVTEVTLVKLARSDSYFSDGMMRPVPAVHAQIMQCDSYGRRTGYPCGSCCSADNTSFNNITDGFAEGSRMETIPPVRTRFERTTEILVSGGAEQPEAKVTARRPALSAGLGYEAVYPGEHGGCSWDGPRFGSAAGKAIEEVEEGAVGEGGLVGGEHVAGVGEDHAAGVGDAAGEGEGVLGREDKVGVAVDDEGGAQDAGEAAVTGPAEQAEDLVAVAAESGHPAKADGGVFFDEVVGRAGGVEEGIEGADAVFGAEAVPLGARQKFRDAREVSAGATAGRTGEDEGADAFGPAEGEFLGDHASHGSADYVCALNAGRVEDGAGVAGHAGDPVRAAGDAAAAGAAIVEHHHAVAWGE
jgi:hypothetical protein